MASSSCAYEVASVGRGPRIAGRVGCRRAVSWNSSYRSIADGSLYRARVPPRRLPHRPARTDDPRRGLRQPVRRQALPDGPEVANALDLQRPQWDFVVAPDRKVFQRNPLVGVPVFDGPRAAAGGIG